LAFLVRQRTKEAVICNNMTGCAGLQDCFIHGDDGVRQRKRQAVSAHSYLVVLLLRRWEWRKVDGIRVSDSSVLEHRTCGWVPLYIHGYPLTRID